MQSRSVPCIFEDNLLDPKSTAFIKEHVDKCCKDIDSLKELKAEEKKKNPTKSIQQRIKTYYLYGLGRQYPRSEIQYIR